jgi:hypothetical protein
VAPVRVTTARVSGSAPCQTRSEQGPPLVAPAVRGDERKLRARQRTDREVVARSRATVHDHDLYLTGFAGSWCVRMLLERVPDVAEIAEQALGAPISSGDADTVRLLLTAGADPTCSASGDGQSASVIAEALAEGAPTAVIALLLSHGADAEATGPGGHPGLPGMLTANRRRRRRDRHRRGKPATPPRSR